MADDEDSPAARRGDRLDDPGAPHAVVRRRELAVLHGDHERLRHEVEVLGALKKHCVKSIVIADQGLHGQPDRSDFLNRS